MIGRVYRWRDAYWRVIARGEPFDRGPRRNVLLERVAEGSGEWVPHPSGERVCRPFRGLRRA